jgi:dolichol-phosphate mannosyltransferase
MPAFNEAAGIVQAVTEAQEALSDLDYQFEILVVDDGSSDVTARLVEELASTSRTIRLIRHPVNMGYGAALRTGFEHARFECIAFTDADGQFYLEDLERLMPLTREFAIVSGYREKRQDPWLRRFYSWGYNKLVRFLLGTRIRDCDCALKVYRREVIRILMPQSRGFFANAEMLCKARRYGLKVAEVGVRHRPRRQGVSKVSLMDIPRTLGKLIPFWWSMLWTRKPLPLVWPNPPLNLDELTTPAPTPTRRKRKLFRPTQPR